jgi:very-short-patch-repair endonuclease
MRVDRTVIGQRIDPAKQERALEFRQAITDAEHRLWQSLRGNRLKGLHFRRQQVIDGFIVDFYCHQAAVIVEVDGPIHSEQVEYDFERERLLTTRGFRILLIKNDEVENHLAEVLQRISDICKTSHTTEP